MAKRFTDTDKWKRPWFSSLSLQAKVVWFYILDECDNAGIWHANFRRMSFDIDFNVNQEQFESWFAGKFEKYGDRYLFRSFIEFQYGELNENNNAHKSVLSKIAKLSGANQPLRSPSQGAQDKDKDKDKEKDKEKGGVGEKTSPPDPKPEKYKPDLKAIYAAYPLKKGKGKGMEKLKTVVKTPADYESVMRAIVAYRTELKSDKVEKDFIKHFSTFMNCWEDYLDDDVGQAPEFEPPKEKTFFELIGERGLE